MTFPHPFFGRNSGVPSGTTYPTIAATNHGTQSVPLSGTFFSATLPASISAGDLLMIFVAEDPASSSSFTSYTTPSGWTAMWSSGSTAPALAGFYKVASGSEGSSVNISITKSNIVQFAWTSYRITGYTGAPVWGTRASGTASGTNNADAPNLTSGFGSVATLWFAVGATNMSSASVNTSPANYSNLIEDGATSVDIASLTRQLTASSENPGIIKFTGLGFGTWYAQTVAVQGT